MDEKLIKQQTVSVDRKSFTFDLCENERGRFVRILEHADPSRSNFLGRPQRIIVPEAGLAQFIRALEGVQ
jgi:hypothetical protein